MKQTNNANTTASSYWIENELSESSQAAEISCFTILFIFSFCLNVVILFSYRKTEHRSNQLYLNVNLCVANLAGSIIALLYGQGDIWLLKVDACFPVLAFDTFWFVSSLIFTFIVFTDCFVRARRVYKGKTSFQKTVDLKIIMTISWCIAAVFSIITLVLLAKSPNTLCYIFQHYQNALYSLFLYIIILTPLLIMAVMEIWLYKLQHRYERSIQIEEEITEKSAFVDHKNDASIFHLTHALQLCWLPYALYTIFLMNFSTSKIYFQETRYKFLKTFSFIRCASCLLQPLIIIYSYPLVNSAVKALYKSILDELLGEEIEVKKKRRPVSRYTEQPAETEPASLTNNGRPSRQSSDLSDNMGLSINGKHVSSAEKRVMNNQPTLTPTTIDIDTVIN